MAEPIGLSWAQVQVHLGYRDLLANAVRSNDLIYRLIVGNPWERPDRNPMPALILFPRVDQARLAAIEARSRTADAWQVLRHGAALAGDDDYDDD